MTAPAMYYYSEPALRRAKQRSQWPQALYLLIPLGLLIALIALADITTAGILYAISVLIIAFWQPHVALMLAFAFAPFVQELPIPGPVHISLGEFTLALCLPAFLITGMTNIRFPVFLFCTLLYLGACVATCIVNVDKQAISPMVQMGLYLVVTVLIFSSFLRNPQQFVFILEGSLVVACFLAILTYTPLVSKLGLHKNALGASMSTATVIAIECWFASYKSRRRRRIFMAVVIFLSITLLYTLSRGAWLGAVAGVFVIMALRRQFKLFGVLIAVLAPLLIILFFLLPEENKAYATAFDSENANIGARLATIEYTLSQFQQNMAFGVGIHLRKDIDATNVICVALAESGLLGLISFTLMHAAVLRSAWKTQKLIPRSDLLYSPVALGGALVIARLTHGLVDHYWSRGPILQAWAAAGMCTAVYFFVRKRRLQAEKKRKAMIKKQALPAFGGPDGFGPQLAPGFEKF